MTEYEKLSLRFQATIASGLALQLAQGSAADAAAKDELHEQIEKWQESLVALMDDFEQATSED